MTDWGLLKYFLGIKVNKLKYVIFINQTRYALDVLKRFKMINSKVIATPISTWTKLNKEDQSPDVDPTLFKKLVGSLIYLTATITYIMFVVKLISRFMETPKEVHWQVDKRILRYIAGTISYDILYSNTNKNCLIGYTYSDFVGSLD